MEDINYFKLIKKELETKIKLKIKYFKKKN